MSFAPDWVVLTAVAVVIGYVARSIYEIRRDSKGARR